MIKSDPKNLFMHYKVVCTKEDSDPKGHEVRVKFDLSKIDTGSSINNLDVKVSCSCPAFLYWGAQWNLHQLDSLEGVPRPKLVAPTEQLQKRDTYFICKHVKVVSDRITPAISNVLNRIKDRLKLERIRKDRELEIEEQKKEVERLEKKNNPKPKPKKPSKEHLDMGQSAPKKTRPGVI